MNGKPKTNRCAIYTRKSTDHNLGLEFNSLHAQREACEAYIKSQQHEGWQLVPGQYDDGAFSGASLDRPDIQRLLADIAAGRIDTVVVYKVDRLTRSLTDFARLIEIFDRHGVSFVSITQAFNTTSSMGRLTLNVLLSFAQFEREVIGERVRDKVAASKKKGLFMGGGIPLGYINQDKKLVIVPAEAERVRWIFRKYLEFKSVGRLLEEMARVKIRTKALTLSSGERRGGVPFGKGALTYLLKNRCYVGEIVHKQQIYAGEHEAIIDREMFEAVQATFCNNAIVRKVRAKASPFLLTSLLFDSEGHRMSPTHTNKKGARYRYYVSQACLQGRNAEAGEVSRVSAPDIEILVTTFAQERYGPIDPGLVRSIIETRVQKIIVQTEAVVIDLIDEGEPGGVVPRQIVSIPWSHKPFVAVKGVALEPSGGPQDGLKAREATLTAIAKARVWVAELMTGVALADIAGREGKGERQIRLLIPLAFMPPQAVRAVIDEVRTPVPVAEMARQVPWVWPSRDKAGSPGTAAFS